MISEDKKILSYNKKILSSINQILNMPFNSYTLNIFMLHTHIKCIYLIKISSCYKKNIFLKILIFYWIVVLCSVEL